MAQTIQMLDAQPSKVAQLAQAVLLICVKYGSDAETARYLESLRRLEGQPNLHVLIVDNSRQHEPVRTTERDTILRLCGRRKSRILWRCTSGTFDAICEEHPLPDWVIVSNVDLLIRDPQFLQKLAALRVRSSCGSGRSKNHDLL